MERANLDKEFDIKDDGGKANVKPVEFEDKPLWTEAKSDGISFDKILTDRIGYGKSQILTFITLAFISINDGAEALVISFILPVLEKEWNIEKSVQSILGSMIFLGFMLGSFLSGFIGDRFGRRRPTFFSIVFLLIFGVLSIFPPNFTALVIIRFFYGAGVGIVTPLMSVLMTEISPVHLRGRQLVLLALFWSLGALFSCILATELLDGLDKGNWRGLLGTCCVPIGLSLITSIIYSEESPRFHLLNKNFVKAFKIIDKMIEMNGKTELLTAEEKERLEAWSLRQVSLQREVSSNTTDILNRRNYKTTLALWTMWFALSSVYYGIVYVLPTIVNTFGDDNKKLKSDGFKEMIISVSFELPSCVLAYFIIELNTFGRKRTMVISFFFTTISALGAFFSYGEVFIMFSTSARFFINLGFQIIYPYTAELYPTLLRSRGLGLASAFSRLGGILMPWIILLGFQIRLTGPFLLFGLISLLAVFASSTLHHDTTGRELDAID